MKPASTMKAMVTMGHGGLEQIVSHENWPCPKPDFEEVLIKVGACGLNNTDVNTRTGWYSKTINQPNTDDSFKNVGEEDHTWGGSPISFPRIQGADVCGEIISVGEGVDSVRIGERVITDNWLRDSSDINNMEKVGYFGSERNGGFAEYTTLPSINAIAIKSNLNDAELATFSCSYSTAEGMLERAKVNESDTVLVTGASGGVGGALVQLAKRRGARVIAMASDAKHYEVKKLNPSRILSRAPNDLRSELEGDKITVVADVVGGPYWPKLIDVLERGGRYTCSGAIAGPIVEFDLRTFYLRDLTFTGSTIIDPIVTKNLVRYIEQGEIKPILADTYPLEQLREAQKAFISKKHTGNIVITL